LSEILTGSFSSCCYGTTPKELLLFYSSSGLADNAQKHDVIGLVLMFLKNNKIVGHNGGTLGARTEAFINLETKARVVVCGDGNGGTFLVALDLIS
jgi:hypothetical protein